MQKILAEKKCPVCGKSFIPAPMLVYKDGHKKFVRTLVSMYI